MIRFEIQTKTDFFTKFEDAITKIGGKDLSKEMLYVGGTTETFEFLIETGFGRTNPDIRLYFLADDLGSKKSVVDLISKVLGCEPENVEGCVYKGKFKKYYNKMVFRLCWIDNPKRPMITDFLLEESIYCLMME